MKTKPELYIDEVRLLKRQLNDAQGTVERLESQMLSEIEAPPTTYAQHDPRWAGSRLGSSPYTLGGQGCLISSVASMLADVSGDPKWTPQELNTWLTVNHGYSGGSNFIFNSIDALGIVKYESLADYAMPAPMDKIERYLSEGGYVIVKVDFNPATMQVEQHYCRYLGNGRVMDPWYGDIADIVPRYRGKTAAEAIWRAVYYKRAVK
jgi:hypothetical protein